MLNKAMIIGNLGDDVELKYMPSGGAVATISVATTHKWKDKQTNEKKEQTEWHRVALFNRSAEVAAEYLKKGSKVYIEGRLRTQKWTDAQGVERYTTEIVAEKLTMLDSKPQGYEMAHPASQHGQASGAQGQSRPQSSQPRNNAPQESGPMPPPPNYDGAYGDDFSDDIPFNSLNHLIKAHLI